MGPTTKQKLKELREYADWIESEGMWIGFELDDLGIKKTGKLTTQQAAGINQLWKTHLEKKYG